MKLVFNDISLFTDAGHKAAIACNHGDMATFKFHFEWSRRAARLERNDARKAASDAFDKAFKAARRIRQ